MPRNSEIILSVTLDDQNLPETIHWQAEGLTGQKNEAKAILLSIFEGDTKDTLKLDLWTKSFQMIEMDRFMFATLNALAETYLKATNNQPLAEEFKKFARYFGQQTEILP